MSEEQSEPEVEPLTAGGEWILAVDLPDSYVIPAGTSDVELWY